MVASVATGSIHTVGISLWCNGWGRDDVGDSGFGCFWCVSVIGVLVRMDSALQSALLRLDLDTIACLCVFRFWVLCDD